MLEPILISKRLLGRQNMKGEDLIKYNVKALVDESKNVDNEWKR